MVARAAVQAPYQVERRLVWMEAAYSSSIASDQIHEQALQRLEGLVHPHPTAFCRLVWAPLLHESAGHRGKVRLR